MLKIFVYLNLCPNIFRGITGSNFQIKPLKIVLFFVNSVESGDMHSVSNISVSTLFTDVIVYSFLSEGFDSYMYPLLMTLLSYQ